SHQERFDGTGYPRGLKGEQIPLGARMFSLADTLDAITSNRPYRAAQTVEAAREEIERWAGRQFDPEIVRTFISMDKNIWSDLRKEIDAQIHRFAYPVKSSSWHWSKAFNRRDRKGLAEFAKHRSAPYLD